VLSVTQLVVACWRIGIPLLGVEQQPIYARPHSGSILRISHDGSTATARAQRATDVKAEATDCRSPRLGP
jgi:hypothetical protein